ncbi:MAG: hypothetical protein KDE59_32415, partial [Anaerolineales bacterium]|nr:hypothetical protein [Anaerolineales bacterium]
IRAMTQDEFKQLKAGDRVTHPAFIGFLTIAHVEQSYDYEPNAVRPTSPPTPWTDAFTADTGHRLKIGDERDVRLLQKLT